MPMPVLVAATMPPATRESPIGSQNEKELYIHGRLRHRP